MKLTQLTLMLALMTTTACATTTHAAPKKRVLMMISEGFYAPEYYEPRRIFEDQGFEIQVAGKYSDPIRPDRRQWESHSAVQPDVTFDRVDVSRYDAVVFAGGNGAWEDFFPNSDVHRILTEAMKSNKTVALLCSSTGLLGVANNFDGKGTPIAQGRHVTGYVRVAGLLSVLGKVNYDAGIEGQPHVVVDGNLITGRDPISSQLFGETVARVLGAK